MELVDGFNRKINYLRISVTDRCNLRCIYCMPSEGIETFEHSEILTYEEILRVVEASLKLGIRKVRITGGEPLVRREILNLIREIRQMKGVSDLTLTTNGVLLEDFAEDLWRVGIRRINISLDTLKRDRFFDICRRDFLAKVLRGIEKAEKVGFNPIKINCVAIKGVNDDEIVDFAKLTEDKPFHVRFIEFMPMGDNNLWGEDRVVREEEAMERIERYRKMVPVDTSRTDGIASLYRFEKAAGIIGFISPISNSFCDHCNRLRLTADGKLRACLFSDKETDLKQALRNGSSQEELENLMLQTIRNKPKGHVFHGGRIKICHRSMSTIGG